MSDDVTDRLIALGAEPEEIERARRDGNLSLLALAYAAVPGEQRYTAMETAERAGISEELASRFWRALGFPDVPGGDRVFTDADVEALATVNRLLVGQMTELDVATQMARVLGSSLARIAEAQVTIGGPPQSSAELQELWATVAPESIRIQSQLMDYVWRRHLHAAAVRATMSTSTGDRRTVEASIGFADLVGFTALSQQLSDEELAKVVSRFEEVAYDLVASHGGRVAKMIGDEVMFVVNDAASGLAIGLALAEAYAEDALLSDVRVGLAVGPVLSLEGDYFGPVVNRASRIVNIALPGSVVVSDDVHDQLADDDRFAFRSIRPRYFKGIGRLRLWAVRRPGDDEDNDDNDEARARRRERRARMARVGREAFGR